MNKEFVFIFLLLISGVYSSEIIDNKISIEELPYIVSLSLDNNTLIQDSYVSADITINYLNDTQKRSYIINYLITDTDNNQIIKDSRTVVVEKETNFKKQFFITKTILPGKYFLNLEVKYENYTAKLSKEFYLSKKIEKDYYLNLIIYFVILLFILIILILILFERNKLKDIEKKQPGILKRIYDEFKNKNKKEETLHKLKKELRLLNEARSLRVITKESYENGHNTITRMIDKINRKIYK